MARERVGERARGEEGREWERGERREWERGEEGEWEGKGLSIAVPLMGLIVMVRCGVEVRGVRIGEEGVAGFFGDFWRKLDEAFRRVAEREGEEERGAGEEERGAGGVERGEGEAEEGGKRGEVVLIETDFFKPLLLLVLVIFCGRTNNLLKNEKKKNKKKIYTDMKQNNIQIK